MKTLNTFLFLCLILIVSAHAKSGVEIKPKLNKVNVFLTGAELHFEGNVSLQKGPSELYLTGVSWAIQNNSIQAKFNGNVKILSISLEQNMIDKEAYYNILQDSVKLIISEVEQIDDEISIYEIEKRVLTSNIDRLGSNGGVNVSELTQAMSMYRSKLKELNKLVYALKIKREDFNAYRNRIEDQIDDNTSVTESSKKVIKLIVETQTALTAKINLSYMVSSAGWAPKYDIRASRKSENVTMEYKANVFNDCGIDWKMVKLVLTTADPSTSLDRPELGNAWALDLRNKKSFNNEGYLSDKQLKNDNDIEYTTISVPEQDVFLTIESSYSIPSDKKPYLVDVNTYDLPAAYKYFAVPRKEDNVYMAATITNWTRLNLIEGPSSIYFDDAYLGESYLDTKYSNDTLIVSLGVNRKVQLTKVKKLDVESEKTLGSNRHILLTYDIDVKNNNSTDIKILVEDQVPISQDSDIEVDVIAVSNANYNEVNGKLKWDMTLKPGESRKLTVKFEVLLPKSKYRKGLAGIQLFHSGVKCPKFR